MSLELTVKQGRLADIFPLFEPDTIQHAHEIMDARRDNPQLRNQWFWTADSALYRMEDGEAVLYFGDRDTNLVFRDIQEATQQLIKEKNYKPSREGIDEVVASAEEGKTSRIKLSDLKFKKYDDEWSYFEIGTKKAKLNETQQAFAEKVYGQGEDFRKNMTYSQNKST